MPMSADRWALHPCTNTFCLQKPETTAVTGRHLGQAAVRPSAGRVASSWDCMCCVSSSVSAFHSPWPVLGPAEPAATVVVVHSLSRVQLFVTPWTAARQASLSFTVSRSLLKFMSIESVMPSNHLALCYPPSPLALNLSQHQGLLQ